MQLYVSCLIRTNRNFCGMYLMCALLGKASYFGLMTDEGRKAKWLTEVNTKGEPFISFISIEQRPSLNNCLMRLYKDH